MAVAALMAGLFFTLYLTVPPVRFVFPEPAVVRALHVANAVITFVAIVLATYYFRVTTLLAEAELEARATTDPLTGIYNRRRMVELLEHERARSGRTVEPFAVVLTDVDHFKGFNDRHGHECGEQALVTVAEVLSGRLRRTDHLAR
jgi:PleD family two-component response regulator